jgi:menaquinone-dependent protoporphyrinogen oxidase
MLVVSVRRKVREMKILVSAGSKHGATLEIAQAIGERLERSGHEVVVAQPEEVDGLSGIEAAVIGSGVYAGRWLSPARELVEGNVAALGAIPVWLFSSGPVGDPPKPEEDPIDVAELMASSGAVEHRVFSGRIDPSLLGFGERAIVKALRASVGDFRDWDAINSWADRIASSLVAGQRGGN